MKQHYTCVALSERRIYVRDGGNWVGLITLIKKEMGRFLKVWPDTIVGGVVSSLLFYAIFAISMGQDGHTISGVPYLQFLVPGLVMMLMAQNAFSNNSSSIVIMKGQGNLVDILMAPLSSVELLIGYVLGGMARGIFVGATALAALAFFAPMTWAHPWFVIYYGLMGIMLFSLLGLVAGIWADKWDQLSSVSNFIITPATFLSGSFYALDRLPPFWQTVSHFNPLFYMIDGVRYGFVGVSSLPVSIGLWVMALSNLTLGIMAFLMLRSGYKLRQ